MEETGEDNALHNVKFHRVELAQQHVKMANFNRVPQLIKVNLWFPMMEIVLSCSLWLIDEAWEQEEGKAQAEEQRIGRVKSVPKFTNQTNEELINEQIVGTGHYQWLQQREPTQDCQVTLQRSLGVTKQREGYASEQVGHGPRAQREPDLGSLCSPGTESTGAAWRVSNTTKPDLETMRIGPSTPLSDHTSW